MGIERERVRFVQEVHVMLLRCLETSRALRGGTRMARAATTPFSGTRAIFEKFIALLGFHGRKLHISKATREIMPGSDMGNPL